MDPAIPYPTFMRQRKQIWSGVDDITEELVVNEKLTGRLRKLAKHMKHIINISSSNEKFPSIFAQANSSLSKFNQILTEINCKIEVLLIKEIKQWNSIYITAHSNSVEPFTWDGNEERVAQNVDELVQVVNSEPLPKAQSSESVQNKENANSDSCLKDKVSNSKMQYCEVNVLKQEKKQDASSTCQKPLKVETVEKIKKDESSTCKKPLKAQTVEKIKKDASSTCKKPLKVQTVEKIKKGASSTCTKPLKAQTVEKIKKDASSTCKKPLKAQTVEKIKKDASSTCKKPLKVQTVEKIKKDASSTCKKPLKVQTVEKIKKDAKKVNKVSKINTDHSKKARSHVPANITGIQSSTKSCSKSDVVVTGKKIQQAVPQVRQHIENMKLSFNTKYEGYIVLMVSPLEFYIHFVVKGTQEFDKCKQELELYCKKYKFPTSKPNGRTIALRKMSVSNVLGDYGLLYLQSVFHRVKIENWNMESTDDLVIVNLIDIGGTRKVSLYQLHPIPKELMRFPVFATRCHLAGVTKKAIQIKKATDFFRSWVNKTKTKTVIVEIRGSKTSEIPNSLPVVIYDGSSKSSVNDLVMLKVQDDAKKPSESLEDWNPMSEAYKSNMNMYDFDVDDPAAAIYGYVGKDYDRVCKLYGQTGKCYKKACKKEHVLLDSKGFTTDKEGVYVWALNPLEIPKAKVLHVRVTHIESPSSFYCVLDVPESNSEEETLLSLHSYLNESRNVSEMKKMLTAPAVGQAVIATFPNDKTWRRARVVSVLPEKDECTLFYVDHGSTGSVSFSCVRVMEPRYLHLPFQAIFCEICGIGDQRETFHLAVRYLEENLIDVSKVEIVSSLPGEYPHLLVNLYNRKGENIAKKLMSENLVTYKENILLDETKMYLPG